MTRKTEVRDKIILHLGGCPDQNITEIMTGIETKGVKTHRNSVSKAVEALKSKKINYIHQLSTYKTYGKKGVEVSRYGLTTWGMGEYIILSDYSTSKMRAMFYAYRSYDAFALNIYKIIIALDEVLGKKNEFMTVFTHSIVAVFTAGLSWDVARPMLIGLVQDKLNKKQRHQITKLLDLKKMGYSMRHLKVYDDRGF